MDRAAAEALLDEVIRTGANVSGELSWSGGELRVDVFAARMVTTDHTAAPGQDQIHKALVDLLGIRSHP